VKTDENVEKERTLVRTDCSWGIRMRAQELNMHKWTSRQISTTNINMKMCVPKWSRRIRMFLATKQIPTPWTRSVFTRSCPIWFFLFQKLRSSLRGTHLELNEDIHKKMVWQIYLKHFHKMTIGDASRRGRLV
jgi:hypothetical protein